MAQNLDLEQPLGPAPSASDDDLSDLLTPPSLRGEGVKRWQNEGEEGELYGAGLDRAAELERKAAASRVARDDDGPEDEEEGQEGEEGEEEARAPFEVPDLGTEPEVPKATYEQALAHYKRENVAQLLRQNGYEVAEDCSNLREAINTAQKEDFAGLQEVYEYADTAAKQHAEKYATDHILPWQRFQQKKGIVNFLARMSEDFLDIGEVYPVMDAIKDDFFRRWPELLQDPIRALPLMYAVAKEKMAKGEVEPKKPLKKKAPAVETGGKKGKASPVKKKTKGDIDFSTALEDPLQKFGFWG